MKDVTPHFFAALAVLTAAVVAHGLWSLVLAPWTGLATPGQWVLGLLAGM